MSLLGKAFSFAELQHYAGECYLGKEERQEGHEEESEESSQETRSKAQSQTKGCTTTGTGSRADSCSLDRNGCSF